MKRKMKSTYKHTQVGFFTFLTILIAGVFIVPLTIRLLAKNRFILILGIIGFVLLMLGLFSTFTIEIAHDHLSFWFGIKGLGKTYALHEIQTTQAVKNPWYYLWGIKTIPGGWLYAIAPGKALEIVLKNGHIVRLGTTHPEKVKKVLDETLASQ
jgi:hypothetical protein